MSHHCSQVAAAKDHTVVLTEEGYVYTFGLNTFHQLGLAPPPAAAHVPKQVGGSREVNGKGLMTFCSACNNCCPCAKGNLLVQNEMTLYRLLQAAVHFKKKKSNCI